MYNGWGLMFGLLRKILNLFKGNYVEYSLNIHNEEKGRIEIYINEAINGQHSKRINKVVIEHKNNVSVIGDAVISYLKNNNDYWLSYIVYWVRCKDELHDYLLENGICIKSYQRDILPKKLKNIQNNR